MEFKEVKDSGKRQEFNTGSKRDTNEGKGRYDLISPIALKRLAKHFENGAVKYGDRNWELGQPMCRYLDSAIRHIYKHLEGHREEDHLAAGAWNLMAAIHTEEMIERGLLPKELDNRASYLPKEDPRPFIEKGIKKEDMPELTAQSSGIRERPSFIVNEVCMKNDRTTCNIGYACDACPYNKGDKQ